MSKGPYRTTSGTSLPGTPSTPSHARGVRDAKWMLFNDFCVTVCPPAEVLQDFGGRKIPCLLYYTQVWSALPPLPPPPPKGPGSVSAVLHLRSDAAIVRQMQPDVVSRSFRLIFSRLRCISRAQHEGDEGGTLGGRDAAESTCAPWALSGHVHRPTDERQCVGINMSDAGCRHSESQNSTVDTK